MFRRRVEHLRHRFIARVQPLRDLLQEEEERRQLLNQEVIGVFLLLLFYYFHVVFQQLFKVFGYVSHCDQISKRDGGNDLVTRHVIKIIDLMIINLHYVRRIDKERKWTAAVDEALEKKGSQLLYNFQLFLQPLDHDKPYCVEGRVRMVRKHRNPVEASLERRISRAYHDYGRWGKYDQSNARAEILLRYLLVSLERRKSRAWGLLLTVQYPQ